MTRNSRVLLALVAFAGARGPAGAQIPDARPGKCLASEYRQFDFWLGDWDAYRIGGPATPVARNRVELMLGGCAVREVYRRTDGYLGESFSGYDSSRHVWHQSWITNEGELLLLDGGMRNGRMVLQGPTVGAGGRPAVVRGTWSMEGTVVREVAETSFDNGVTWTPLFELVFRRRPALKRP